MRFLILKVRGEGSRHTQIPCHARGMFRQPCPPHPSKTWVGWLLMRRENRWSLGWGISSSAASQGSVFREGRADSQPLLLHKAPRIPAPGRLEHPPMGEKPDSPKKRSKRGGDPWWNSPAGWASRKAHEPRATRPSATYSRQTRTNYLWELSNRRGPRGKQYRRNENGEMKS